MRQDVRAGKHLTRRAKWLPSLVRQGSSGRDGEGGFILGLLSVVFDDSAEQVLEVGGGVLPAERPGGAVVAVDEGEQGFG